MTTNNIVMSRLKNVILSDSSSEVDTLNKVLKSDIYALLTEYMLLDPEAISLDFCISEEGKIILKIEAAATRLIPAGYTIA